MLVGDVGSFWQLLLFHYNFEFGFFLIKYLCAQFENQAKQISFFAVKAVTVYCSEFSVPFVLSLASHKLSVYSLELSKTSLLWRQ